MTHDSEADPSSRSDEQTFLAVVRSRNPLALEHLLMRFTERSFAQAWRTLGSASDADDAVQEAYLQLARTAHRYDGHVPFAAWLARLVSTACLRVRRAERRRRHRELIAQRMAPLVEPSEPGHGIDGDSIRAAVAALPQGLRDAIDLHYFAGLSQEQCGKALGLSENAVAVRIHRGRERLRRTLAACGGERILLQVVAWPIPTLPAAIAGHAGSITSAWASATLPRTTIHLSLTEKGAWYMSQHPLICLMTLGSCLLASIAPFVLHSAEAAGVHSTDSHAAPTTQPVARPWQGRSGTLLTDLASNAPLRFGIDMDFIRQQSESKPWSLVNDLRAGAAIAQTRHQLELWSRASPTMETIINVLHQSHALVMQADPTIPDGFLLLDAGHAAAQLQQSLSGSTTNPKPTAVGAFTGIIMDQSPPFIIARSGERTVIGTRRAIEQALAREAALPIPHSQWSQFPYWTDLDLRSLMPLISGYAPYDPDVSVAALLGNWSQWHPHLRITMGPRGDAWDSTTIASGLGVLPLRIRTAGFTISPKGHLAVASIAMQPHALAEAISRQNPDWPAALINTPAIEAALTGDIAIIVDAGSPTPKITIEIGMTPTKASVLISQAMLASESSIAMERADGKLAWTLSWSFMAQGMAVLCPDRLIISSAGTIESFVACTPSPASGDALSVAIDLPAIARLYGPMLKQLLPNHSQLLPGLPFPAFAQVVESTLRNNLMKKMADQQRTLGQIFAESSILRANLIDVFGTSDPATICDHSISVYSNWNSGIEPASVTNLVVYRLSDGWHNLADVATGIWPTPAWTLDQLRLASKALTRISGPEANDLAILALPEQPVFDSQWLPDPAILADHLPFYTLSLIPNADGATIQETGLPLIALAPVFGAIIPNLIPSSHNTPTRQF